MKLTKLAALLAIMIFMALPVAQAEQTQKSSPEALLADFLREVGKAQQNYRRDVGDIPQSGGLVISAVTSGDANPLDVLRARITKLVKEVSDALASLGSSINVSADVKVKGEVSLVFQFGTKETG